MEETNFSYMIAFINMVFFSIDDGPLLKEKNLVKFKERGIVLKGLSDWYNHIIKQFYILLDKYEFLSTFNSNDLSFLL